MRLRLTPRPPKSLHHPPGSDPGPRPKNAAGEYHTHGGNDPGYNNEHFSNQDKWFLHNNHVPGFLGTPGHTIQEYDPATGKGDYLQRKGQTEVQHHRASLILGVLLFVGCFGVIHNVVAGSYTPKNGFVPDKATAVRVAEAILVPIYGEKQIASERPFSAELKGGVWTVTGHLPEGWTGGVAEVRISKMTCQVISLSHGK